MKKWLWLSIIPLVISMCMPSGGRLLANNDDASQLSKAQTAQKLQKLHIPYLRQNDNCIEYQLCLKRFEYDNSASIGKKYIQTTQRLQK